jgi:hypothetical protein
MTTTSTPKIETVFITKPTTSFTRVSDGIYSLEVLVTKGDMWDNRKEYQMRLFNMEIIGAAYASGRYHEIEQVLLDQLGKCPLVRETMAKVANKLVNDFKFTRVTQDQIQYK